MPGLRETLPLRRLDFSQTDQVLNLNVGSVILAPGFQVFDARLKPEYGYGRYPNVITSLEFERMLVGHRADRRPYPAPLRRGRAGENRLDPVRRVAGCRPRPALLLLGLLHVRHQAGHYCPGA